jgi:hypothetical protein
MQYQSFHFATPTKLHVASMYTCTVYAVAGLLFRFSQDSKCGRTRTETVDRTSGRRRDREHTGGNRRQCRIKAWPEDDGDASYRTVHSRTTPRWLITNVVDVMHGRRFLSYANHITRVDCFHVRLSFPKCMFHFEKDHRYDDFSY